MPRHGAGGRAGLSIGHPLAVPRFHVPLPLSPDLRLGLPPGAARHAQVLRLQPGDAITLFNGEGGEWSAVVERMGRSEVEVRVGAHQAVEREAARTVHLAVGLMAAERMDWLIEKATELGAASLTPLLTARSSLRLSGERAARKRAHWQAVAVAASEQCGRNRVLQIHEQRSLADFLAQGEPAAAWRAVLSLDAGATPLRDAAATPAGDTPALLLSGPEGGLGPQEEAAVRAAGFVPVSLGARVLRAETAPLAGLVLLAS